MDSQQFYKNWRESIKRETETLKRLEHNVEWMRSEEIFTRYLEKRAPDCQINEEREPNHDY